jgi:hypothetical protein
LAKDGVAAQQQQEQSSSSSPLSRVGPQQHFPLQQEEQQQLQHPAEPQQEAHFWEQIPVPLQHSQQACSVVNNPALSMPGEAAQQQQVQSSASSSSLTQQSRAIRTRVTKMQIGKTQNGLTNTRATKKSKKAA